MEHPSIDGPLGIGNLLQYLSGQIALKDAVERIKVDTRRFAKRQNDMVFHVILRIHWLNMDTENGSVCIASIHKDHVYGIEVK